MSKTAKVTKARKPKAPAASVVPDGMLEWIGATVTTGESFLKRYQQNADALQLISIAQGLPATLARINARACASQTLRLYRSGGGTDPARKVSSKRLSHLRSGRAGFKAAEWATSGGEAVEVVDHPVLRLLNRPTQFHTGRQLEEVGFWYRQICGDSFDQLISDGGVPIGRAPMIPCYVSIQPDEQAFIRCFYYSRDRLDDIELPPAEVLHLKHALHPTDPYHGAGWLNDVRAEARILATDAGFDLNFAERGYQPPFVLEFDEGWPGAAREKEIKASLAASLSGWLRMHVPLLAWKARYKPTQTPPKELQSVEKRREHRLAILAASGVPESMWSLNDANLASAQQGYTVQYLDLTVRPMCNSHAEQLTEQLLPRFGVLPGEMWFAYDDPVPQNEAADADLGLRELQAGAITVDEYRHRRGLGPLPKPKAPTAIQIAPELQATPKGDVAESATSQNANPLPNQELALSIPAKTVRVRLDPATLKAVGWWGACADGCACDGGHKAAGDDLPAGMVRELTEWYERVIRANARPGPVSVPDDLEGIFARWLPDLMRQAASVEGAAVGLVDFSPDVTRAVAEYLPALSAQVRQVTAERIVEIQQVVGDALREGLGDAASVDQIAEEIASLAPEEAGYLAERVVRTETAYASTQGRMLAWERAGVAEKEWLLAPGGCPVCADLLDRKPRAKAQEPFARAGETYGGQTLGRDCYGPPLHPNCKCAMLPVVEVPNA